MDSIYHLTTRRDWKYALATGDYRTKDLDHEKFIHCSNLGQLLPVAMSYFPNKRKLAVLVIDPSLLTSELKWEKSDEPAAGLEPGEKFPHVYGPLNLNAAQKVLDMERDADDNFVLPDELQPESVG